jgi:cytochrome P450
MTEFVYDPTTVEFQENPLPLFSELRDNHPVYHNPDLRFWTLTRFADVWDAVHDHETYASDPGHYPAEPAEPTELMPKAFMDFGIFYMDPPRHNRLRAIMSRAFTVRRVADLEPSVRRLANELIDGFIDTGHCEFVHDFAAPLSTTVIGELLGVPRDERWQFRMWAEKLEQRDPSISVEVAQKEQEDAHTQIFDYLSTLVAQRRKAPRDDLIDAIISAEVEGERLDEHEILSMCYQIMIAGNETTAILMSNGVIRLAEHSDQRAQLLADPRLTAGAVEEMARFDSPTVQSPPRITTRDVTLHGRTIPKGQPVVFVWMAADHDEREFASPERFDIHRRMVRHLGFGHGLHFCMGAPLARLEATTAFEEFHSRIPDYHLDGPPVRWASTWLRVIGQVPLGF